MNPLYYKMDEQNRLVVGKKPVECISKVIQILLEEMASMHVRCFLRIRAPNSDSQVES